MTFASGTNNKSSKGGLTMMIYMKPVHASTEYELRHDIPLACMSLPVQSAKSTPCLHKLAHKSCPALEVYVGKGHSRPQAQNHAKETISHLQAATHGPQATAILPTGPGSPKPQSNHTNMPANLDAMSQTLHFLMLDL
jgi:hypothetical protein